MGAVCESRVARFLAAVLLVRRRQCFALCMLIKVWGRIGAGGSKTPARCVRTARKERNKERKEKQPSRRQGTTKNRSLGIGINFLPPAFGFVPHEWIHPLPLPPSLAFFPMPFSQGEESWCDWGKMDKGRARAWGGGRTTAQRWRRIDFSPCVVAPLPPFFPSLSAVPKSTPSPTRPFCQHFFSLKNRALACLAAYTSIEKGGYRPIVLHPFRQGCWARWRAFFHSIRHHPHRSAYSSIYSFVCLTGLR